MDKIDLSKKKKSGHYRPKRSKSGWIGVQCHQGGFRGYVWLNGKKIYSRVFPTAEMAGKARDMKAKAIYGDLAVLNF